MPGRRLLVLTAFAVLAVGGTTTAPAAADVPHDQVVTADPVDWTPHVLDGTVRAIATVGERVVVGGDFTMVREANGEQILPRTNLFAYNRTTGQVDPGFVPQIDGTVRSLAAGTDGTIHVGGNFRTINGQAVRSLAKLHVSDGTAVGAFTRARLAWGVVQTMVRRGDHLYIGGETGAITDAVTGETRTNLARLDATTGAVDASFDIEISEQRAGGLKVYRMAVDQAEQKLLINGTFTKVNGQDREQIAMVDLTASPTLSSWSTDAYADACSPSYDTYMRGMDFSPDGSYFVVVTSGGAGFGTEALCDSAARWETGHTGPDQQPTWVNWTGGDTLLSVSATGAAVYVGGHQRWMDNPEGNDSAGPGAVERSGIAAIHPATGLSKDIPWNPTRTRGHGVETIVATVEGDLLVGSDTDQLGHEYHGRIGMFPPPQ